MTNNQAHGKKFEDFIKACGLFRGSSDAGRLPTASYDIEAKFDRERGLPTSVKTSGGNSISMSDARRFFGVSEDFRMIVGKYKQRDDRKEFAQIHEFILPVKSMDWLRGDLTLRDVTDLHNGLLLSEFPREEYEAARTWAHSQNAELAKRSSKVILHPKIDSAGQRRLQCSVHLNDLIEAASRYGKFILHDELIGDLVLPIVQVSSRRQRKSQRL